MDQGLVVIGLMEEGPASGSTPTPADVESWNQTYGVEHPMLADPSMSQISYIVTGYPTYVVIDRDMTIATADLWPFDTSYIIGML